MARPGGDATTTLLASCASHQPSAITLSGYSNLRNPPSASQPAFMKTPLPPSSPSRRDSCLIIYRTPLNSTKSPAFPMASALLPRRCPALLLASASTSKLARASRPPPSEASAISWIALTSNPPVAPRLRTCSSVSRPSAVISNAHHRARQ